MDERFDRLAEGLSMPMGTASGEGTGASLNDLSGVFGEPVVDDTVTGDAILYAKVVCHDQKKRGGSLSLMPWPSSTCGTSDSGGATATAAASRQ